MFKGSIVALVTPMFDDGTIDYPSLQRLVQFHLQAGTHGIVSVGTTGEGCTLPVSEHVEVVRRTVEYADGRLPVIAGSGANSTTEAIELSRALESTGIQAFLTVVPYYNKPQQRGLEAHFRAIADATTLPNILYNVPGRTVVDLHPDTVAVLSEHPNIVGIKDATGDLSVLAALKARVPRDFALLSGDDATSKDFMLNGGQGVISVTANIVPRPMAQLCELATSGQATKATVLNDTLAALHDGLFIESNPVLPKHALFKMGLIGSPALRLPLVGAELSSQQQIETLLKQLQLLH